MKPACEYRPFRKLLECGLCVIFTPSLKGHPNECKTAHQALTDLKTIFFLWPLRRMAFVPLWELACKRWAAGQHRPHRQQAGSYKNKGTLALCRKAFLPLWELACKRWAADLYRPLRQQAGSYKTRGTLALRHKAFDPFVGACLQAMGCGPAQAASPAGWLLQKERLFGALPQGLCAFVGACLQAMGCGPAQAASPAGWLPQKERLFGVLLRQQARLCTVNFDWRLTLADWKATAGSWPGKIEASASCSMPGDHGRRFSPARPQDPL